MKYKTLLFDIDDTLLCTKELVKHYWSIFLNDNKILLKKHHNSYYFIQPNARDANIF